MAVKIKYISMNIEPNGNTPAAGMTKLGSAYHGASGIGRGILLTRQGGSYLPLQCLPKMVPATDKGIATNNQMAITTPRSYLPLHAPGAVSKTVFFEAICYGRKRCFSYLFLEKLTKIKLVISKLSCSG